MKVCNRGGWRWGTRKGKVNRLKLVRAATNTSAGQCWVRWSITEEQQHSCMHLTLLRTVLLKVLTGILTDNGTARNNRLIQRSQYARCVLVVTHKRAGNSNVGSDLNESHCGFHLSPYSGFTLTHTHIQHTQQRRNY